MIESSSKTNKLFCFFLINSYIYLVYLVSIRFPRYICISWLMEFIFSYFIFIFWCVKNHEMVNKVEKTNCNPKKKTFSLKRSTEEIFALFVSIAFLVDAGTHIYQSKSRHDSLYTRSILFDIRFRK
jgi:glucan phosphoethanolaminetransferase (alkaline phosphatase superfamily)